MSIGKLCSRGAVSTTASATLAEVAALMRDANVGTVVITKAPLDRPVPVGIVTDRDIVRAQLERVSDLSSLSAGDVMTGNPLVLNEEDSVEDAISRLRARRVRRAPVISTGGALVGLISTDDLLTGLTDDLIGMACVLARQTRTDLH